MLDVLEWVKKHIDDTAGPRIDREPGSNSLTDQLATDPATALAELRVRLKAAAGAARDADARGAALAAIQDAGAAHVATLLAQYIVNAGGTLAAREAAWKSLVGYQLRVAQALCASAAARLTAAGSVRAMSACRLLAKLHLVHYATVPGQLWKVAYSIHAGAEKAGFAATPVHAQSGQRTTTTVEQELLRLALLSVSAPDMLAPEQIEVADRIVEQLGAEFTLRQPGIADNPFCFEPASEFAPRRAQGRPPAPGARYFGPGMGYASLERIGKQAGAAKAEDFKAFGKEIAPRMQLSTVQHLLTFWRADCPYAPPAHEPAAGGLQVVHGYPRIWQYLSELHHGAGELSLADSSAGAPQPPETWELKGAGGNELGAEVPQAGRAWVKCGGAVGFAERDGGARCVGMIRRMHARPDGGLEADIAVLSREPREVLLRAVIRKHDDSVFSDASSRQFAGNTVRAIILSDGAGGAQPPNLLLPPEEWQEGRVYEVQSKAGARFLRGLQAVRRWDDYVRATFEWLAVPD
jgi:hypothetical protein